MNRALLFLSALWWLSVSALAQISPGPLSRAHVSLEGPTKCASCHSFGLGARRFKCTNCHAEIAQRIAASQGFHAKVAKNSPGNQDCVRCHTEHFGPKFNIVKWEPSHDDFDHRQTGYVLQGKHAQVACERCHNAEHVSSAERKAIRVKDLSHTYLGLSPQCSPCHADEHRAQLGSDCARCHTFQAWKPTAGFEHSATKFALTGLHGKVACAQCHHTLSEEGKTFAKYSGIPFSACSNCHKDVHHGAFQGDCQSCHNTSGWKQVTMLVNFDHSRTAFPLHGSHAKVACFKCHAGSDFKQPVAHTQCANCHTQDPHKGQFKGQDCESCHNEEVFKPSLFTAARHSDTAYPLLGKHAAVACAKCHREMGRDTNYHIKYAGCLDCHQDAHGGQFAATPYADRCDQCHTVDGFRPSTFTLSRHQETRFHLSGGHMATACAECHKPAAGIFPTPSAQFKFQQTSCENCHADPHGGPAATPAKQGCQTCHSVRSWKEVTAFDHATTNFPLQGAHRAVLCAECHRPPALGAQAHQISFQGAPTTCAGCHEDIHGGQFAKDGAAEDCATCHALSSWKSSTFDHETRSTFSLKGAHQNVPCRQCHIQQAEMQGRLVVVYKKAPTPCAACHSDK
jgi:hypothetical protein